MDLISRWVTQIIVFLLLAIIVDLLIPKTSMRKYIKLVIGLILMLIFLKPVFYLFTIDFQAELSSSLESLYEGDLSLEKIEDLTNIQKIDIETVQAAYILEEMIFQLKDLAREPLLENYHVEITNIEFKFFTEQEISFEGLEEVIVYLDESNDRAGIVNEIEEVNIGAKSKKENIENIQEENIKRLLQEVWELHQKNLSIIWEGGTS